MLRAKSIGELVDITVKCECNKKLNAVVNLNNIKVINDENLQNTNIEITKEINFLNLDVMEYECLAEPTIYFLNRLVSLSLYFF